MSECESVCACAWWRCGDVVLELTGEQWREENGEEEEWLGLGLGGGWWWRGRVEEGYFPLAWIKELTSQAFYNPE